MDMIVETFKKFFSVIKEENDIIKIIYGLIFGLLVFYGILHYTKVTEKNLPFLKEINTKIEKIEKEDIFYVILIIAFIVYVTKRTKSKEVKDIVTEIMKSTFDINNRLEMIRKIHKATYVSISQFHNGEVTLAKLYLLKMSRLFEARDKGLPSRIGTKITDSFMVGEFMYAITEMTTLGYYYIDNTKTHKDKIMSSLIELFGAKSVIYLPIYYKSTVLCGFMCIEYDVPTDFDTEKLNHIRSSYKQVENFFF